MTIRLNEYSNTNSLVNALNSLNFNSLRSGSGHNIYAGLNVARTQAFTSDQVPPLLNTIKKKCRQSKPQSASSYYERQA